MPWQQIVEFYYPGTSWGRLRGRISVWSTGDTTDDLVVAAQAGLTVTRTSPRKSWTLPANGARQWRVNGLAGGRSQVQFVKGGGWRTWKVFSGDAEFSAAKKRLTPGDAVGQPGLPRAAPLASPTPGGSARDTVNILSLESYLRGVVPLEIPAPVEPGRRAGPGGRGPHLRRRGALAPQRPALPDLRHQRLPGLRRHGRRAPGRHPAVRDTARQGLTYEGRPAFTQFSASSGGWTSAGSTPYLVAQEDPYDGWDGNGVHDWTMDGQRRGASSGTTRRSVT